MTRKLIMNPKSMVTAVCRVTKEYLFAVVISFVKFITILYPPLIINPLRIITYRQNNRVKNPSYLILYFKLAWIFNGQFGSKEVKCISIASSEAFNLLIEILLILEFEKMSLLKVN